MRLPPHLYALTGVLALGLCGCASTSGPQPQVQATQPAPAPAVATNTDIRNILAAGGLDTNNPSQPRGHAKTAVASATPAASAAPAAPAAVIDARTGARPTALAALTGADPSAPAAPQAQPAPPPGPAAQALAAPPPIFAPGAPLPQFSPNSPPATTTRLPTVAIDAAQIPADAPREARVTTTPINYNFLNGTGSDALPSSAYAQPPHAAPQPNGIGGIVQGPAATRAALQPLLNPDRLAAPPRPPRGRAAPHAPKPNAETAPSSTRTAPTPSQAAPHPAPPPPPAPPVTTVRRF